MAEINFNDEPIVQTPEEGAGNNGGNNNLNVIEIDGTQFNLDAEGNALNTDGSVFKTKDELNKIDSGEVSEVEVDGVVYKLDTDGNAIDAEGKIVYKKEDLEEPADVQIVGVLKQNIGIVITDESGKEIEYEDSLEGITKYVKDALKIQEESVAARVEEAIMGTHPELPNILRHLELNGNLDKYKPSENWSKIVIADDTEDTKLESIVRKAKLDKGDSETEINEYIKYLKEGNKLKDVAKESLKYLSDKEKATIKAEKDTLEARRNAEIEAEKKKVNYVANVIKQGKLKLGEKEFVIPEIIRIKKEDGTVVNKTRDDFFDYLYKPVSIKLEDGRTVETTMYKYDDYVNENKKTIEHDLLDALKTFAGYNMESFIETQVNKQKTLDLKKLITKKTLTVKKSTDEAGTGSIAKLNTNN